MRAILVFFHCPSNTGYAIRSYERAFREMARRLVGDEQHVHFAYTDVTSGPSPDSPHNVVHFDPSNRDPGELARISDYVGDHGIDFAFGVDQPLSQPSFPVLRRAGIRKIGSYWGAPMGAVNSGIKLFLKRVDVRLRRHRPDHFVFESQAMARTATHGRGLPADQASVVYLGVDTETYRPRSRDEGLLARLFGIPADRRILFFSGHMEERKGVRVLVDAMIDLVDHRGRRDLHLLVLGNRPGEEQRFIEQLSGTQAEGHVTFGGYRNDVPIILPQCDIGAIASTGWDSFTVSALEMASAGLPLLVSRLQGLVETVDEGVTGYCFPPGMHQALADRVVQLLDHSDLRREMSRAARDRILSHFTVERQVDELVRTCLEVERRT